MNSYDNFIERNTPRTNHLDKNASFNGWAYETYGEELAYVLSVAQCQPKRVATIVEADGNLYLCPGFQVVNKFVYFVFDEEVPDREYGKDGEGIPLDDPDEDDPLKSADFIRGLYDWMNNRPEHLNENKTVEELMNEYEAEAGI